MGLVDSVATIASLFSVVLAIFAIRFAALQLHEARSVQGLPGIWLNIEIPLSRVTNVVPSDSPEPQPLLLVEIFGPGQYSELRPAHWTSRNDPPYLGEVLNTVSAETGRLSLPIPGPELEREDSYLGVIWTQPHGHGLRQYSIRAAVPDILSGSTLEVWSWYPWHPTQLWGILPAGRWKQYFPSKYLPVGPTAPTLPLLQRVRARMKQRRSKN